MTIRPRNRRSTLCGLPLLTAQEFAALPESKLKWFRRAAPLHRRANDQDIYRDGGQMWIIGWHSGMRFKRRMT